MFVADARPRLVQGNPPVDADDVAPRLGHRFEQGRCAGAKVNHGDAGPGCCREYLARVGHGELPVVGRAEGANP